MQLLHRITSVNSHVCSRCIPPVCTVNVVPRPQTVLRDFERDSSALQQLCSTDTRCVTTYASRRRSNKESSTSKSPQPPAAVAADAASLFSALIQLASRATIVVGGHQAYAILETLEVLAPQQLHKVPTDTLASGLWAMTRLQLQPSQEFINAVAHHLLQQQDQTAFTAVSSSSSSGTDYSSACRSGSRLACCNTRTYGTLCYSLNFFLLRDMHFWAAAAAAALQHLPQLKPGNLSNLLQAIAASGWLISPAAPNPSAHSSSAFSQGSSNTGANDSLQQAAAETDTPAITLSVAAAAALPTSLPTAAPAAAGADASLPAEAQSGKGSSSSGHDAVLALLQAVEASLLRAPRQLKLWRMRDISQLAQAYALVGYSCGPLFATLAHHLLESEDPLHEQISISRAQQQQQQQQNPLRFQQQQYQQQQSPPWRAQSYSSSSSSVLQAAWPPSSPAAAGRSPKPWHDQGRGPARLADCRANDAAGLAWAFVHSFCPNKLLLHELAVVLITRASQLHAADVNRLLWAYATAGVADRAMLSAVTAAVCEEMHGVLPRTAAGAVWALGMMRHESPAFMEAALDRLAACLEAAGVTTVAGAAAVGSSTGDVSTGPGDKEKMMDQMANGQTATAAAAATGSALRSSSSSSANTIVQPSAAAAAAAAERPSVLQQLFQGSHPGWLSGGPAVSTWGQEALSGELGQLAMLRSSQQQQQLDSMMTHHQRDDSSLADDYITSSEAGDTDNGRSGAHDAVGYQQTRQQQYMHGQQQSRPAAPATAQQQSGSSSSSSMRLTHRDIAEAVWACGRLQHYNASFFRALRPSFKWLLPGFSDAQLVDVLWGLARLNLYDGANMDAAADELMARASRLPASAVSLCAWTYASLRHRHPKLFAALSKRAVHLAVQHGALRPLDVRQLVYAAAKLGIRDEALMKAGAEVLKARVSKLGISLSVGSIWGFAVAGHFDEGLFEGVLSFLRGVPVDALRPLQLLQIFQATTLMQDALGPGASSPALQLSPGLASAVQRQWLFTTRRSPASSHSSGFADQVLGVLQQQLGLPVRREVTTADGLFSIDLALEWRDRQVAVEVDGPEHFTRNKPYVLLGSSAAKQHCLQARGWVVLSVPFYQWRRICDCCHHQQQQRRRRQDAVPVRAPAWESDAGDDVSKAAAAAAAAVAAAQEELMAARADWLREALDSAVLNADVPTSIQQLQQVQQQQQQLPMDDAMLLEDDLMPRV